MDQSKSHKPPPSGVERDQYFRTDHFKSDLSGRSVRGGAVTAVAQILKFLLVTAGSIALARLLHQTTMV
jgi:hypothetical protein